MGCLRSPSKGKVGSPHVTMLLAEHLRYSAKTKWIDPYADSFCSVGQEQHRLHPNSQTKRYARKGGKSTHCRLWSLGVIP